MSPLLRTLSLRYLLARKRRTAVTVIAIALGVTLVVAVELTGSALTQRYDKLLAAVAGRADLQVRTSGGQGFPQGLLTEVDSVPGIEDAVPSVSSQSKAVRGPEMADVTIYGVDLAQEPLIRDYRLTAGGFPARHGETAISDELADAVGAGVGDTVRLLGTRGLDAFVVVGVFDARSTVRGSFGPFGVLLLPDAQSLFGKDGKLDTIDLLLTKGAKEAAVRSNVADVLAGRALVADPLERAPTMEQTMQGLISMLTIAGWISLFAGAFIIYTNVSRGVVERRRELAIARAIGLRRAEGLRLVLIEAAVLGGAASGLGLLLGTGIATALVQQLGQQMEGLIPLVPARVAPGPRELVLALGMGAGVSLAAAYLPARATLGIDPVEAMRPGDIVLNGGEGQARWLLAGLALVAVPLAYMGLTWSQTEPISRATVQVWGALSVLVFVGAALLLRALLPVIHKVLIRPGMVRLFGVTGRLAADNLVRQPGRSAATALALMVSLAYMVGMGGFFASIATTNLKWFERTLQWDLSVSTAFVNPDSAPVELAPGFADQLDGIPGVTVSSPMKFTPASLSDGRPINLKVFATDRFARLSDPILTQGSWREAQAAMLQGGATMISPNLADDLGLSLGDTLTLPTPSGPQTFRIVGVIQDVTPAGGSVLLDWQDYVRYWDDETVTAVVLKTEPGQLDEVRQAIADRWGDSMRLVITSNRELSADLKRGMNGMVGMMTALTWVAIAVAGLALANTLFSNLAERQREFGTLRAVGARRSEVTRIVLGEAIATGLIGGVPGIALGLGLYALFINSGNLLRGFPADPMIPWVQIGMAVAVALFLAPLVSLLPARWAARLDVVDALRYE